MSISETPTCLCIVDHTLLRRSSGAWLSVRESVPAIDSLVARRVVRGERQLSVKAERGVLCLLAQCLRPSRLSGIRDGRNMLPMANAIKH